MKTVYWEGDVRVTKERFYPISELSRDAQETAWQNWLEYADYPWSKENRESLDRFSEIFGVTVTDWEYGYRYNIRYLTPDWDMYSLKGVRLWKYLVNNGYADMINDTCPLTGYYIDEALLDPFRDFLKHPKEDTTLEDLVHNALWNWVSTCHQDFEDYYSFEGFQETAEELDWKFTEDGNDMVF